MAQDRCPVLSAPSPRVPITAAERARPSGLFGFHDHHARAGPVVAAGLVSWRRRPWPGLPARRLRLPRRDRIRSRRLRPGAPLHRLHRRRSQLRLPGRSQPGSHNDRIGVAPAPLPELPPTTHRRFVYVNRPKAGDGTRQWLDHDARQLTSRVLAAAAQGATVPGSRPACASGARRLVGDPFRPLGDRGEIAGLDQLVRLEMREGARTGGRQAQRGHGVRVGQHEDARAVVLSEHPVVRFKAAASRPRQLPDDSCPVRGLGDEPFHRLTGEAEQNQVLCHYYHPQVQGRRSDLALPVSIAPAVPGRRDWPLLMAGNSGQTSRRPRELRSDPAMSP